MTMIAELVTWLLSLGSIILSSLYKQTMKPPLATFRYSKTLRTSSGRTHHEEVSTTPETRAISYAVHSWGLSRPYPIPAWAKLYEYLRWAFSEIWVRWQNGFRPLDYISSRARFSCYVFEPYYHWFGLNQRVVTTSGLNQVVLQNCFGDLDTCVNGGSFNYAGLYELPSEYEKLQRKALRDLPHSGSEVQELSDELARRLVAFFQTDCCFLTSTGFGSNILGFSAIASKDWMIILDEKCHNSMFSGAFLSEAGARRRFKHNDMNELEAILISVSETFSHIVVAVEGMYSMDGTLPPLARLHELKQRYGFVLYCDEAHSFLSIGRTGRGCLEAWNDDHPTKRLPADLIDIRSATLSKAVGAIGGFVCASSRFESSLGHQNTQLAFMCEPIPTAAVLQALWALSRPLYLSRGLARLQIISKFCHEELRRQGVFVYGEDATPMLPVYAGSPTQASELSYLLRTLGLVCPPISQPAVELWESRVRIGLSPGFTDKDVDTLVNAVIEASKKIGVLKASRWSRRSFNPAKSATLGEQLETERALRELSALMNEQIAKTSTRRRLKTAHCQCVLQAGYHALAKHGLGAGSSRFILGTFTPHLDAERVTSEYFRQPATITYADAGLGLMSTIAALCRPIWGYKRHNFLVPRDAGLAVESGLRIAPRNSGTTIWRYNDEEDLVQMIKMAGKRTYITAYVAALRHGDDPTIGLAGTIIELARAQTICPQHITLIVNTNGESAFTESIPNRSWKMIQTLVESTRSLRVRVLLSGSYRSLGGPSGGYLTGDRAIVEELRYSSRSYMFSTSPLPVHMAMITAMLETRRTNGLKGLS